MYVGRSASDIRKYQEGNVVYSDADAVDEYGLGKELPMNAPLAEPDFFKNPRFYSSCF